MMFTVGSDWVERPTLFHVKQGITVECCTDPRRQCQMYMVILKGEDHDIIESEYFDEGEAIDRATYLADKRPARENVLELMANIEAFRKLES